MHLIHAQYPIGGYVEEIEFLFYYPTCLVHTIDKRLKLRIPQADADRQ